MTEFAFLGCNRWISLDREIRAGGEDNQQDQCDEDIELVNVRLCRRVQLLRQSRNDQGRHREQHQCCYHSRWLGFEPLRSVFQAAKKKCDTEDKKGIAEY